MRYGTKTLLLAIAGVWTAGHLWQRGPAAAAQNSAEPKNLKIYVSWSGPRSEITERGRFRVTDAKEWAAFWQKHLGTRLEKDGVGELLIPQVDFEACMAVLIFEGRGFNSNGIDAVSVTEEADRILLRYRSKSFQTFGPNGGGVSVTPYGILVLPRSAKALVLEQDVQGLIGQPPIWKEVARFEKL